MDGGASGMVIVGILGFGSLGFLIYALVKSIRSDKEKSKGTWEKFGLSLSLMVLFLATWIGQAIAEWQVYTDEQREHNEPVEVGGFISTFAQSTLENWQSEFLQLFSFVTLAALYIHKGSAESKDSDEEMLAALRRIEQKLDKAN